MYVIKNLRHMQRISLRLAFVELLILLAINSLALLIFKNALVLQVTFRQLMLLLMPGLTVYFALRLRIPSGRWRSQFRFELFAYCLLVLIQAGIAIWIPILAPDIPVVLFIGFMMVVVTVAFLATRTAMRFWIFWDRLRQAHLRWALTHAHMIVALVLVGMGFLMIVIALAIIMPDRTLEPLSQLLIVFPFSVVIISPAIVGLIVLLGLSSVFSYWVMRPTVQRLQNLVLTTDQLSSGNYAARSPVSGKDEVMHLQVNFNRMAAELEHTVHDLRQERDAVNTLLQLRRELMTSISHELRTPIATMRVYTESLLDRHTDSLPEPVQHDLRVMVSEVTRLQALVDDLFTLARSETRQLPLRSKPTDIGELVTHVVEAIAPLAWQSYRIHVAAEIAPDLPLVQSDAMRVEQILRNLIQNSLQHTPPGGIVTVDVNTTPNQRVRLSVEDTGEGIDQADLPYVWDRFYRSRNTGSSGAGLGLALVKELTEAMGGCVEVHSTPHEWTQVIVLLPYDVMGAISKKL